MPSVFPRKLAVLDQAGEHLFWVDEERARELVRDEHVELKWGRRRVHALIAKEIPGVFSPEKNRPSLGHLRLSHNHETATNPPGVWELVPSSQVGFGGVVSTR